MRWLRAVLSVEFLRGGFVCLLVILMAAFSSGAIGSAASSSSAAVRGVPPSVSVQADDDDDNGDTPTIVLNVNSTMDEVDADPGDGNCASAANRCTLRAAVMEANLRGGHHTINLPAGNYVLTLTNPTPEPDNGGGEDDNADDDDDDDGGGSDAAIGDIDIKTDMLLVGSGAASTIIDGNNQTRLFEIDDRSEVAIRSATIRNGKSLTTGGAVASYGEIKLEDVIVSGNVSSNEGGAIYGNGVGLVSTIVSGNSTTGGEGGGIYASTLEALDSTISGNSSTSRGGGAYTSRRLELLRSTISGNSAPIGAGLVLAGNATIVNSTLAGNTASGNGTSTGLGGGVHFDSSYGETILTNVTIANNTAPRGSGIYKDSGDLHIKNSIVATNNGSADCFRAGPIISDGNNIDGTSGCGFLLTSDQRNTNPLLATLADNGGPTKTHALQAGSPAIDGGTNSSCPATDQRGIQRPRDGDSNTTAICDIGAFEAPGTLGTPPDNGPIDDDNEDDEVPLPDPDNGDGDDDNTAPGQPGQTVVRYEVCPGVAFPVRSITGFSVGDTVRINPGGQNQEDARVVDVGCDGMNLHLAEVLKFRHQANEQVVVVSGSSNVNRTNDDDRNREQSKPKTEEQRQQAEQTNRSGHDDLYSEGDVAEVNLSKQPPEIVILTRDGRQTVQLLCGSECPAIRPGDYVEVEGVKENEGLFHAEVVTVTRR